jgi:predicted transposase YdaD
MAKISKDILWKGIIEDLFEHFLIYFYPNAKEIFNFKKGFQFLDKELEQLFPPSESKHRFADKLVKVYTKKGDEKWILVHIEVQGYEDKTFSDRMYAYNYRIFDKYQKKIAALAIFTDDNPSYCPSKYHTEFLDTSLTYRFKTFKLLDFTPEYFQAQNNPFAVVLETALYGLKKNKLSDKNLFALKLDLARRFYQKGYPKGTFWTVSMFIRNYVSFGKKELLTKLDDEIDTIAKTRKHMGIIAAIQEEIKRQSLIEGEEKGLEKGQLLAIIKMSKKGFASEMIANILEIPLSSVENALKEKQTYNL